MTITDTAAPAAKLELALPGPEALDFVAAEREAERSFAETQHDSAIRQVGT